jgi:hypothetical protein
LLIYVFEVKNPTNFRNMWNGLIFKTDKIIMFVNNKK